MEKIKLDKCDKRLLRLCKGIHPYSKKDFTVMGIMKKYYKTHYVIDPDKYPAWKGVIFNRLFDVFMKIRENSGSMNNRDIEMIFFSSFEKNFVREQEEPVERAIAELYGQIQCTTVKEKVSEKRWKKRFDLY